MHSHSDKQQPDWPWLALFVVIGLALRLAAMAGFSHVPEGDELAYKSMALNWVGGHGIVDEMGNRAMYNVGYPLLVLAPVFFLAGEDLQAMRMANVCLGGLSIVLCYLAAKEAGAGRLGRLVSAAVWAVYLPASVYTVYLFKENLMTPIMLGVVWCALRLARAPSVRVAVGCGILLGLLALVGNAGLSLLGMVVLALVLAPVPPPRRIVLATVMLIAAALLVVPWMIRNQQVIGAPVLNTNGGFNLYLGNNPAATGMYLSISDTPRGASWGDLRKLGEVRASDVLKQDALAWIKANPVPFLSLSLKKAAYFWTPPFHQGQGEGSSAERVVRALWGIQFVLLMAAALGTLLIRALWHRPLVLLWVAIGCYTAVHMLFYVSFRYREPMMPVLGIMAALVVESLLLRRFASMTLGRVRAV
ncbi:4-amino-4-deoxy-L-arabinose transferase-like glycosyltransferase [Chitinivorax tropicus]|uniref:4-amino-4-deoxy-L-arabinose transferase-like glycosyltransferase n=1 Tax=Chitinivorax tropicus TaxID=714531 RepID=A0A840MMB8_9PROT|nr:hypothetical protein [Chitinivorax tropicus]MBB5017666.1 4-amino-4-deoxy-L-arabinose transferase-like glycosyltransferase [Chitinivorax tropicus]